MPGYVLYTFSLFLPLWPDLKNQKKDKKNVPLRVSKASIGPGKRKRKKLKILSWIKHGSVFSPD